MTWRALLARLWALWRLRKAVYVSCADCGSPLLGEEIAGSYERRHDREIHGDVVCVDCVELRRLAEVARQERLRAEDKRRQEAFERQGGQGAYWATEFIQQHADREKRWGGADTIIPS